MTRVFTGLKPTGHLTLGNYLGAIRPLAALGETSGTDLIVCVADLHALTMPHSPVQTRSLTVELATTLLACGLQEKATLFIQSHVGAHTELSYLLECTATYGEMHRMIQFKEKAEGQESVRLSLLTYPALMAADILAYQTDIVPVGEDQKQHLEITVDIAERFNRLYGEVFTIPSATTPAAGARIKDLREPTMKMGKSHEIATGILYLLDTPDVIAEKIKRATTDTDAHLSFNPAERTGVSNLAVILAALTNQQPADVFEGMRGAGDLKAQVTEAVVETLTPIRVTYEEIAGDESMLRALLADGANRVRPIADETVRKAKEGIGLYL